MALPVEQTRHPSGELIQFPTLHVPDLPQLLESKSVQEMYALATQFEANNVIDDPAAQILARRARQHVYINPKDGTIFSRNAVIVPNKALFNRQFYWDTERIADGWLALDLENRPEERTRRMELLKGAVMVFDDAFHAFGKIPNQMHINFLNRSEPPVFSKLIMAVYHEWDDMAQTPREKDRAKEWLASRMETAYAEYKTWTEPDQKEHQRHGHHVDQDSLLSRWGVSDVVDDVYTTLCESGNDKTHEYGDNPHDFQPVLLNALLANYERNFAEAAQILGRPEEAALWEEKLKARIDEMNEKMWDDEKGWFFNYNAETKTRSDYMSLNGFMPMALGLVTKEQAQKMVANLAKFDTPFGLAMATEAEKQENPFQWDRPFIWPNMVEFVCEGLDRYEYYDEEEQMRTKSVAAFDRFFQRHHTTPERLDGLTGDVPRADHYPPQSNFGWTNAHLVKSVIWLKKRLQQRAA